MYCFSSQEYAHDVGVAFINSRCVAVGELINRFLRNVPDVGMGYWLTKYANKGQNDE